MPVESINSIASEADTFLKLFAQEKNIAPLDADSRRHAVTCEISNTGSWTPTFEELEHGARMAWRNNARCIGRLFWPSLRVRDRRHLVEPEDIHRELLEHLSLATNGGKIQPLVTVFAPRGTSLFHARIWNHQLLGYAGYEQSDGTILGDPKNLEFTREAQRLGWSGPGTAFDLLPLIIQKSGMSPVLFPPPQLAALEVPLSHPTLPWFSELGLKWYAVPVLSDMCLRIGGIDFCAAPFNGWYMGTEIGSRDLGDSSRYNMLPHIAARMGLDTTRSSSLWRDRALVELNAAVLHSYEIAGVRIVDHHRASSEFMEFTAREQTAGRAVSADWSWIVPPMSGSATPVFHTLWNDLSLLPDYLQQPKAWIAF
jgi:nitric-oxide synthase, bacterial